MEKIPLEEDEDIGSDDVEQENKGLTEEEREELMAPVDTEPDPDFNTALTIEEINNVAEVLTSGLLDKYLGNRKGVSGRKDSKEEEPFDIDKYA